MNNMSTVIYSSSGSVEVAFMKSRDGRELWVLWADGAAIR